MAALVSAFRDINGIYKTLQSNNLKSEFQQQMLELEKHLYDQFGQYKMPPLFNLGPTTTTTRVPGKHHPLTHSNSVTTNSPSHREHRKLDRCVSEPSTQQPRPVQQQQQQQQQPNSSRYKTELCRPFEESGTCKYGDKCQFAHGKNELRTLARHPKYKTELCRTFHTTGFCPYGPRCHFIHNDSGKNYGSVNNDIPSGAIAIPSAAVGKMPNRHHSGDFDICSFNPSGSTGELSPNSSSMSGSPPSSIGMYLDEAVSNISSPVPPQTAPPFVTNAGFFAQDFVPFTNNSQAREIMLQRQNFLDDTNASISLLSASMDNLNLRDGCNSFLDINRNLRLPIFNQFNLAGLD